MIQKEYREVKLAQIDLKNKSFCYTYPLNEVITNKHANYKIFNPIWLLSICEPICEHKHIKYIIVDGFKRCLIQKQMGFDKIDAFVINDCDKINIFKASVIENSFTRKFNIIEKSLIISIIVNNLKKDTATFFSQGKILDEFRSDFLISDLLIVSSYPEEVKFYLATFNIPVNNALRFKMFADADKIVLAKYFLTYKLGTNKMKDWLDYFANIMVNEKLLPTNVFSLDSVKKIEQKKELSNPQKTNEIEKFLAKLAYPTFNKTMDKFSKRTKEILRGNKIKFSPPKNFEGKSINCNFNFSTFADYNGILEELSTLSEKKIFTLLEIL